MKFNLITYTGHFLGYKYRTQLRADFSLLLPEKNQRKTLFVVVRLPFLPLRCCQTKLSCKIISSLLHLPKAFILILHKQALIYHTQLVMATSVMMSLSASHKQADRIHLASQRMLKVPRCKRCD
jgi:hypothetical protein